MASWDGGGRRRGPGWCLFAAAAAADDDDAADADVEVAAARTRPPFIDIKLLTSLLLIMI